MEQIYKNINIKTSYFAKRNDPTKIVSIALYSPWFLKCNSYLKLTPTPPILHDWKLWGDEEKYIIEFEKQVLNKLNPEHVIIELKNNFGNDCILTCYESSEKFCHRHLVSKWLNNKLGTNISEL